MSPKHPKKYDPYTSKVIKIFVQTGKKIELTVKEFDLESGSGCNYDYLYIHDRDGGKILQESCGQMLIKESMMLSVSNCIKIVFISDAFNEKKGFKFEWREVEADGKERKILKLT